ncbi:MAG: FIST signal transduction protein [Solirubrobacteraceae bacterium]
MPVRIGTGLSTATQPRFGAEQAASVALEGLGGAACDVCVVFASGAHLADLAPTLHAVQEGLRPSQMVGYGAQGVLGDGREVERGTGVAVWAASLGAGTATAFHAAVEPAESVLLTGVPDLEGAAGAVLLADPRSFPTDAVLQAVSSRLPDVAILGGLASAGLTEGSPALFLDGDLVPGGAVGVRFDGVDVLPCVSQGAAPIGPELTITAAEGNVVLELAGQPAYKKLQEVAAGLDEDDQLRLERSGGVLLGLVVEPNKPDYVQGDFLVRPLIGADPRTGAVAVGAVVRPGQVVRLHARDAASADRDLRGSLDERARALGGPPAGALIFACNGRGRAMFGDTDHDAAAVAESLAGAPSAGFFAAGEIGPVGHETFLHGFTATVALFGHDTAA